MKKTLSIILTLFLLFALTGCNGTIGENNSTVETVIIDETIKAHADAQAVTGSGTLPELSAEDRAVKAEIAKYSDTKVDFRYSKQEIIQGKTYNVLFSTVKDFQGNKELVAYKNDNEDEFIYKIDTGKLFLVRINSAAKEKNTRIDMNTAQKIAESYISSIYDINTLDLSLSMEENEFYFFEYSRCISKYETNATFEIEIGVDGTITYIRDNIDVIDGKQIKINDDWIEQKKQEAIMSINEKNVAVDKVRISVEKDVVYLEVYITYGPIVEDGKGAFGEQLLFVMN